MKAQTIIDGVPGGRKWVESTLAVGYQSEDGDFQLTPALDTKGGWILTSFAHDPPTDNGELWTKRFPTAREAQEYAEMM